MTVRKSKNLEFTVNEKTAEFGNVDTNFYTEDKGNASIRMRLKYENSYVNLEEINMRPRLDLFHSDGSIWIDENLIMVLPEYGLIQYSVPDNVIKHKGKVTAKLFLVNQNKSIHVANFNFSIQDSGVDDAVEKEISITLVEDTVRRIIKENSIELLNDDFKNQLLTDTKEYLSSNPDKFKGSKGDTGDTGDTGERGLTGRPFLYSDFTSEQLAKLKGPKGDKGDTGSQGIPGRNGTSGSNGKDFKFEDFTPDQLQSLKGPEGPQGKGAKEEYSGALMKLVGNKSLAPSTYMKAEWGGAIYNTGGYWNPSNPTQLIVPKGVTKVKVGASILWESSNDGYRQLRIKQNGQYIYGLPYNRYIATSTSGNSAMSSVIDVKEGDYFELEVYHTSTGTIALREDSYTWMSIEAIEMAKGANSPSFMLIGHRGATGYVPEHSMRGYQLALDKGADYIELDLQLTKDNKLLCMHDSTLDRTTTGSGSIRDMTLRDIQTSYKLKEGDAIPSLEDVLEKFGKDVKYYIETKRPFDANLDAELLKQLSNYGLIGYGTSKFGVIIQSFAKESLINIRNQYSNIPLVYLSNTFTEKYIQEAVDIGAYAVAPKYPTINKSLVDSAHSKGLKVHTWTVNNVSDMKAMISYGVDGFFTNYLDEYKKI